MNFFNEQNPLTIVMADDHEVVRAGIRRLLSIERSIKILEEASTGEDAIKMVKYYKPRVALLDILMPNVTGIEAVQIIKKEVPETFCVMLTAFEDSKHLENAMNAGADGYLSKDIGAKDLIESLYQVSMGERVFSRSIIKILQNKNIPASTDNERIIITKREQEILNLVARGKTSSEISEELFISVRTVESHRYNLMQKLGIKNAAGLVRYAVLNNETPYE